MTFPLSWNQATKAVREDPQAFKYINAILKQSAPSEMSYRVVASLVCFVVTIGCISFILKNLDPAPALLVGGISGGLGISVSWNFLNEAEHVYFLQKKIQEDEKHPDHPFLKELLHKCLAENRQKSQAATAYQSSLSLQNKKVSDLTFKYFFS